MDVSVSTVIFCSIRVLQIAIVALKVALKNKEKKYKSYDLALLSNSMCVWLVNFFLKQKKRLNKVLIDRLVLYIVHDLIGINFRWLSL